MLGENAAAGFRWRSHEITRLEGLSDAVFAFAITLLVISLEVPRTFSELQEAMQGFVSFAFSFAVLFYLWYSQYRFFRRYGLQDGPTIVLNGALLFVVLFYVYPLKFLSGYLVNIFSGGHGMAHLHNGQVVPMLAGDEPRAMMLIYSGGYVAVFTIFLLLYLRAWGFRQQLELTELERFDTRAGMGEYSIHIGVAVLSLLIAAVGGTQATAWSGMVYMLLAVLHPIFGSVNGRRRRRLAGKR